MLQSKKKNAGEYVFFDLLQIFFVCVCDYVFVFVFKRKTDSIKNFDSASFVVSLSE